ncbi:hypothetical protein ACLOJK_040035 [Asimina triloba]
MALWKIRGSIPVSLPSKRLLSLSFSSSASSDRAPADDGVISSVVSVLTEHRSKSRWGYLKSLIGPNIVLSPLEVSQILLRVRNNPHLALRFFVWSQKKSIFTPDVVSYSTMIHVLARSRLKTRALDLVETAIRTWESDGADASIFKTLARTYRACDSAPFVFDLLIRGYLNLKKVDRAVEIVRMLRSSGIYPMTGTCNSIIQAVAKLRGPCEGFLMYQDMFNSEIKGGVRVRVSPNLQTFNSLVLMFYRDQDLEQIEGVLKEMVKFGCNPNVFTYSILMAAFCDGGRINEAIRLWDEMCIKEIKPDIMAYNTMISGFCSIGQIDRAENLFQEMLLAGINATCTTYECLIKGYCKVGDVDSAIVLYRDMCRMGFWPEASTVDEVIGEMCRTNRVSEGLEFLRDVTRKAEFHPNRVSYEHLVKGFCEKGRMEDAFKLQVEMVGKGYGPDAEIYGSFIQGYSKQGDLERARCLGDEMVEGQRMCLSQSAIDICFRQREKFNSQEVLVIYLISLSEVFFDNYLNSVPWSHL